MIHRATVIGSGEMGTLCAVLLANNGIRVRLWGRDAKQTSLIDHDRENRRYLPGVRLADSIRAGSEPAWSFEQTEMVVTAVPCQFMRNVWQELEPHISAGVPIVSVTKGIENETGLRPTEILEQVCGERCYGVLSGPCIAHEVAQNLPATVVVACHDLQFARTAQEAFNAETFRVYTNEDVLGVELAAALKNVIAVAAGINDGLKLGDNAKASLVTRGLVEITRLGLAMGAKAETFAGLAGVGDLITTCISPFGRNRTAGERIGAGEPVEEVIASMPSVIEGIPTTRSVLDLAKKHGVEMPITEAVGAVLFEGVPPARAVRELMTRRLKAE